MSINIKFDIDTASAQGKVNALKQQVAVQQTVAERTWQNVKTNYTYYSQLSSLVLSNLARAAEGSAALSAIQGLQAAQTAIIGEIAVFQTGKQAVAAFVGGQFGQAALLGIISAMLQASVIAALKAQIDAMRLGRMAEEIRRQLDAYNV